MPPRILMCPPDYYGIEYEINPWMSRSRGSDRQAALGQWTALSDILRGLGVQLELMTPLPGLPDRHEQWMHERFLEAGVAVAGTDTQPGSASGRAGASRS